MHQTGPPQLVIKMSVTISKLTGKDRIAWDEYLTEKKASIYHDSRWPGLIKKVFGHDSHHLLAKENGKIVGVFPLVQLKSLLFGNYMVSMPYFNYGGIVANTHAITMSYSVRHMNYTMN